MNNFSYTISNRYCSDGKLINSSVYLNMSAALKYLIYLYEIECHEPINIVINI